MSGDTPAGHLLLAVTLAGVEPKSRPGFAERWAQVSGTAHARFTTGAAAPGNHWGRA